MAYTIPWHLVGLSVAGDFGDQTIYTDKHGRKIVYQFAPPHKPPTTLQLAQRARFKAANDAWKAAASSQRAAWTAMSYRLSLPMTGLNAWIWCAFCPDDSQAETLQRQSGIALLFPPRV
jgi:hypothetical protein